MTDVTKICGNCELPKPATSEFYGKDSREPDSFHRHCRVCRSTLQAKPVASPKRALVRLDKTIKKAQQVLDNPESSFAARERAERKIRLNEKHRKPYLDEIEAHRRETESRLQEMADAEQDRLFASTVVEGEKQPQPPVTHDVEGNDTRKKRDFILAIAAPEFKKTMQEQSAENDLARKAQFANAALYTRKVTPQEQE